MEEKKYSFGRRLLNSTHLLWWLLLLPVLYLFYDNWFAPHHIQSLEPPKGTIVIPLQADSSKLVPFIYNQCPFTIPINDTMQFVVDTSETFVYVRKDSCWLEHVLKGTKYIRGKDSTQHYRVDLHDRQPLRKLIIDN